MGTQERNLDFDAFIDRRGTDCVKYDCAKKFGKPDNLMGFWVADMDFKSPSCVQETLRGVAEHGVFGYSESGERYFNAVATWMRERHDFEVKKEWLVKTSGVVFALAQIVRAFTRPGDAVMIQQPVYPPFMRVIEKNGRRIVSSDLVPDASGVYQIDFDDFEAKIVKEQVKLFLMCSPHNPVGRVWTKEELTRLGEICLKHKVLIAADEIHHDFSYANNHTVFQTLAPEFAQNCVTCTAPSKTFNTAGLQASNLFVANPTLRKLLEDELDACGCDELNQSGLAATRAAYEGGGEWYEAMLRYVEGNFDLAVEYINNEIPQVSAVKSQGTYLLWVDFRATGWEEKKIEDVLTNVAGVWLNNGSMFGPAGRGYQRMNLACSRDYLRKGLEKMRGAMIEALR